MKKMSKKTKSIHKKFFFILLFAVSVVQAQNTNIGADTKVKISRAEASESQPKEEIEKSFDGSQATLYHSKWGGTVFPVTLTYYFENVERIDYLIYHPRARNSSNGNFMEFELWILAGDEQLEFIKYGDYDFADSRLPSKINFTEGVIFPKAIRFVVKSGAGNLASCAEMCFYQKNTQKIIPPVFTDETCSELLPGVDRKTVRAIENKFYRKLALSLLNDSNYQKSRVFEINPTHGFYYKRINAEKGDEIIAYAGNTSNGKIFLRIVTSNNGTDESTYLLNEGPNNIVSDRKGLVVLMYDNPDQDAEPVRVHVATGKLNKTNKGWERRKQRQLLKEEEVEAKYAAIETRAAEIDWSKIITPRQMKQDIDFFFNFLDKKHPNMYAFVSKDSVKIRKKELYKICSVPMTVKDFHIKMVQLNGLFDSHTGIPFNFSQYVSAKILFPTKIKIVGNQLFIEHNGSYDRVLYINDICVDELFTTITKMFHQQDKDPISQDLELSVIFPGLLYHLTDARSPFSLRLEGVESEYIVEGSPGEEIDRNTLFLDRLRDFRSYTSDSIAIIEYNRSTDKEDLSDWVDNVFQKISDEGIQHLFIDISRNGGGGDLANSIIYNKIEHNGFSYIRQVKVITSKEWMERNANTGLPPIVERALVRLKYGKRYKTTANSFYPSTKGYNGNVYLIQGPRTYSAAVEISAWFKNSGVGKIIGGETGGRSAVYTSILRNSLPNSNFFFRASSTYLIYPGGELNRGILPDIPVELDYSKRCYELDDLKRFLEIIRAAN